MDIFYLAVTWRAMSHAIAWLELPLEMRLFTDNERIMVVMSFAVSSAVGVGLVAFLAFHTYLCLTNQTTMEWATGGGHKDEELRRAAKFRRNPYDVGRAKNWEQVFGYEPTNLRWMISWKDEHVDPDIPTINHSE